MAKIVGAGTLSGKYQVTVPFKVREKMNLKKGDAIAFIEESGRIYIASEVELE